MNAEPDYSNLIPVRKALLDIYREFASLCARHKIPFCAAYGTLLGAVRHQGFIPWDDDFDVHMKRPDYDRFMEIAARELPPHLKLVSWQNTKEYDRTFCKVQETRRAVYDRVVKESGTTQGQGLYIDIFPIDGWPTSTLGLYRLKVTHFLSRFRVSYLMYHGRHLTWKGRLADVFAPLLAPFFPGRRDENDFAALYDEWVRRYPLEGNPLCGRFLKEKGWHRALPTEIFDEFVELPFEGTTIPAPKGWDDYLRCVYGDYRALPPIEKRTSTHFAEAPWKFGPTGGKERTP